MALVTVSGYPCSGKSTRAEELKAWVEEKIAADKQAAGADGTPKFDNVVLVSDGGVHVTRAAYDDSLSEKPARAALFCAVERSLSPSTVTIVDSANYIKGFRYQMYCAAREAGVRVATVRTAAGPDVCRGWHASREENEQYKEATFDNLIMRYEEPSSMVRWDSPLFTIAPEDDAPFEAIWAAITTGNKKPPTGAVVNNTKPPPGTLQTLTTTTSTIVTALLSHLTSAPGASTFPIPSPPGPPPTGASSSRNSSAALVLHLPPGRRPTLAELQRLKRGYESAQMQAQRSGARSVGEWTAEGVARGFVVHLEASWETGAR